MFVQSGFMKKTYIALFLPALLGVLLLGLVLINLSLFDAGSITVRKMLALELPIVILGLISSLVVSVVSFVWLFKKQWKLFFGSLVSVFVFLLCFTIAGSQGGAFLNAT